MCVVISSFVAISVDTVLGYFCLFPVKHAEIATHFKSIVMQNIEANSEDKGNKNVNVVPAVYLFLLPELLSTEHYVLLKSETTLCF